MSEIGGGEREVDGWKRQGREEINRMTARGSERWTKKKETGLVTVEGGRKREYSSKETERGEKGELEQGKEGGRKMMRDR